MGWLLFASIAAMTSFMTLVQLIALTMTLPLSPAPQAKAGSERTEVISVKSPAKKNEKVVSRRSATHSTHHTRRHHGAHSATSKLRSTIAAALNSGRNAAMD
jgi:hypothetical protein